MRGTLLRPTDTFRRLSTRHDRCARVESKDGQLLVGRGDGNEIGRGRGRPWLDSLVTFLPWRYKEVKFIL